MAGGPEAGLPAAVAAGEEPVPEGPGDPVAVAVGVTGAVVVVDPGRDPCPLLQAAARRRRGRKRINPAPPRAPCVPIEVRLLSPTGSSTPMPPTGGGPVPGVSSCRPPPVGVRTGTVSGTGRSGIKDRRRPARSTIFGTRTAGSAVSGPEMPPPARSSASPPGAAESSPVGAGLPGPDPPDGGDL